MCTKSYDPIHTQGDKGSTSLSTLLNLAQPCPTSDLSGLEIHALSNLGVWKGSMGSLWGMWETDRTLV